MPTLWPHLANTIQEKMVFGTAVRRAKNGENRTSLRDAGQVLVHRHRFTSAREATAARLLFESQPLGEWYLPIWHDLTRTSSAISALDTVLTVETNADYRAGGKAVVWSDWQTCELVDIASVGSGSITVSPGVVGSYPAGSLVAPVLTAVAPEGAANSLAINVTDFDLTFYVTEPVDLAADNFATNHDSRDVWTSTLLTRGRLEGSVTRALDFIDSGFGAYALQGTESYSRVRSTVASYGVSAVDRWADRQNLHRMRGRDRPFWLPSWKNDLPLQSPVLAAGTTASVSEVSNPSDLVGESILIRLEDETLIPREVTAAVNSGGNTDLTIAAPGQDVPTTAMVSLMTLVRFDTDEFDIEHRLASGGFISTWSASVLEVVA